MSKVMYKNASAYVQSRNGVYYYVRRVPNDVRQHYATSRLSISLRTRRALTASRLALSMNQRLEDYWLGLRLEEMDIPAKHLILTSEHKDDGSPTMLEACELYLRLKSNTDKIFVRTAQRNSGYVVEALGNKPITSYATSEAAKFRDWCFEKGMNQNTVKRIFGSIRSIINLTMREYGIEGTNAFSGTYMPDRNDIQKRKTIPNDVIKTIQQKCRQRDDELRWIIWLISDTGLRLSEALGLCKDEIHLDTDIPFIDIRTHSWRRLKTRTRGRKIPDLLGEGSMAPSVNIGLPVK